MSQLFQMCRWTFKVNNISNNYYNYNDDCKNISRYRRSGRFESEPQLSGMQWARTDVDLVVVDDEGGKGAENRRA